MFKKILCSALSFIMVCTLLSACGNSEGSVSDTPSSPAEVNTEASNSGVDFDEDPAEVNWFLWNVGGSFTASGVQKIENAINEITLPKINVQVHLEMMEMANYMTQMAMQVTANDKIDLVTTFPAGSSAFMPMVSNGQLLPLESLLEEYAPELLATVPDSILQATTVDGTLYAVPVYTDNTNDGYWLCRESLLTEAGFTAEDIKDYTDIERVFEAVYALHPDMKMLSVGSQMLIGPDGVLVTGNSYDNLGTKLAAAMVQNPGEETKVVSFFETDEVKEVISIFNSWYAAGYIDKDIMVRETDPSSDPTVFSTFMGGNMTRTHSTDELAGEPVVKVPICNGIISTSTVAIMNMAIPVSATEPEAAAALMNLCYTDPELKMLVSYGIEGENYTYAENGGVSPITGSDYAPNTVGTFGNAFLCDPQEGDLKIGYRMSDVDTSTLNYSPLLGFSFNPENVQNEAAQLDTVYEEYKSIITCGMGDEAKYQEFIGKLYASGLEEYLAEIQRQLDEWLA